MALTKIINNGIGAFGGDLTLDVTGNINLDADGGFVVLKDGGTTFGALGLSGGNFRINADASDQDIVFVGNDGGASVTALTLDMSEAGSATFNSGFAANNGSTITTADNTDTLTLISTDADANVAPNLVLYRNSDTPADNDQLGKIKFTGVNDNNEDIVYTEFVNQIRDASDGTEDGRFAINVMTAGTGIARLDILPGETVFNESGADVNFRVESDDEPYALFVDASNDAVCIGKSSDDITEAGSSFSNLQSGGHHYFAVANTEGAAGNSTIYLNRQSADGTLIEFRQANTAEGTITVSGSTVALIGFSGRHESSGIATNTAVGTVVSTIDELDVYPNTQLDPEGGVVANPKAGKTRADHAKVKVSDAVGDACVYGVVAEFTAQDKVIVTSVGIGSVKVTGACAKGDLLESNGDGTAKVQSDDIIRSKTIGKVTIGNSSASVKLVSCVLYCG